MTDKIKRGDLLPVWSATLYDDDTPVDLTNAQTIKVYGTRDGTNVVIEKTVTGTAEGVVSFAWVSNDTATAGDIYFEVEVTWPGAKPQTFPPDGNLVTHVYQDIK